MGIRRLLGLKEEDAIKESIEHAEQSAAELDRVKNRQLEIAKRLRLLQAEAESFRRKS